MVRSGRISAMLLLAVAVVLAIALPSQALAASVTITDPALDAEIHSALGIPDGQVLTDADMLSLTSLCVPPSTTTLAGLQNAKNLTSLTIGGTRVTSLSPLTGLTYLQQLDIYDTPVSDISPISGLTRLTYLRIMRTNVANIAPVASLDSLTSLQLVDNNVTSLAAIAGLKNLTWLAVSDPGVTNLIPLSGLVNLQTLSLSNTSVTSLAPIAGLTKIFRLGIINTPVTNLVPVAGLPLTDLELSGVGLTDVSGLTSFTNLTRLILRDNHISNIAPLTSLAKLDILYLTNNDVTDISPLLHIPFDDPASSAIDLRGNHLDLTPGSSDMTNINQLLNRYLYVLYEPQRGVSIPTGTDVTVTDGQATVTFPTVLAPGTLTVTPYAPRHESPSNFRLLPNLYFDIHPTATFDGFATVTLNVPADYTGDLTKLKVFHLRDNGWETITPSVDVEARTLTFQTSTFSDFVVGEPAAQAEVSTPASSEWSTSLFVVLVLAVVFVRSKRTPLAAKM